MDRHAVPQNIMEVEFKLFGSLTVKQFAYLAAGLLLTLFVYFTPLVDFLKYPLMVVMGLMSLFLSIGQVNGQPATIWVNNFIIAIFSSQERIWKKTPVTPEILKDLPKPNTTNIDLTPAKKLSPILMIQDAPLMAFNIGETVADTETKLDNRLTDIDKHFNFLYKDLPNNYKTEIKLPKITPTNYQAAKPKSNQQLAKEKNVINDPNKLNLAGSSQYNSNLYQQFNVADYQNQVIQKSEETIHDDIVTEILSDEQSTVPQIDTAYNKIPLAKNVNLIKGLIVNKNQIPIISAQVSIKDKDENLVRKAISDNTGMFALTTPLDNAEYFIDIEAKGCKFQRFKVLLEGKELPIYKFSEQ